VADEKSWSFFKRLISLQIRIGGHCPLCRSKLMDKWEIDEAPKLAKVQWWPTRSFLWIQNILESREKYLLRKAAEMPWTVILDFSLQCKLATSGLGDNWVHGVLQFSRLESSKFLEDLELFSGFSLSVCRFLVTFSLESLN
jgi:hypothetical protein